MRSNNLCYRYFPARCRCCLIFSSYCSTWIEFSTCCPSTCVYSSYSCFSVYIYSSNSCEYVVVCKSYKVFIWYSSVSYKRCYTYLSASSYCSACVYWRAFRDCTCCLIYSHICRDIKFYRVRVYTHNKVFFVIVPSYFSNCYCSSSCSIKRKYCFISSMISSCKVVRACLSV